MQLVLKSRKALPHCCAQSVANSHIAVNLPRLALSGNPVVAVGPVVLRNDVSDIDLLIAIPLIPAAPVVITWRLPWEQWLPNKLPKLFLGRYLLYAAFAAWHFKLDWWAVVLIALLGVVVVGSSRSGEGEHQDRR